MWRKREDQEMGTRGRRVDHKMICTIEAKIIVIFVMLQLTAAAK